jgi:hypothetical protein
MQNMQRRRQVEAIPPKSRIWVSQNLRGIYLAAPSFQLEQNTSKEQEEAT